MARFREDCAKGLTGNKLERSKKKDEKLQAISNIEKEIESLKEIKDISDELRMILRILKEQATVLSMMTAVIEGNRQDAETRPQHYLTTEEPRSIQTLNFIQCPEIDANIREWQKMLDADAVQNSVRLAYTLALRVLIGVAQPSLGPEAKADKRDGSKICP